MNFNDMSPSKKLAEVAALRAGGMYDEAIRICDCIISDGNGIIAALRARSRIFHDLGRHKEAFRDIDRLIKLEPDSPVAFSERAEWYLQLGDDNLALADANSVIATGEEYFLEMGQFFRAIASFNLKNKSEMTDACNNLPSDFKSYVRTFRHGGRVLTKDDLIRFVAELGD